MKNETAEKARLLQGWRVFLLEYELAKHYHYPYILYAGTTNRNPLLDMLLPSLLMVRAVSILDDSLKVELQTQGITLPQSRYKDDLYGRISILCDNKTLSAKDDLQKLRRRRNELSHEIAAFCYMGRIIISRRPCGSIFARVEDRWPATYDGVLRSTERYDRITRS